MIWKFHSKIMESIIYIYLEVILLQLFCWKASKAELWIFHLNIFLSCRILSCLSCTIINLKIMVILLKFINRISIGNSVITLMSSIFLHLALLLGYLPKYFVIILINKKLPAFTIQITWTNSLNGPISSLCY